jgi:chromate transporter
MNIYLQLFISFFKIGLLGFGGGYTILSLIQNEVIINHWMTQKEFTDIVAISQMTPSPIGTCAATYVGFTASGGSAIGAAVALTAVILPSLIIMTVFSRCYFVLKDNQYIHSVMIGLRPVVLGLLGAAIMLLLTDENFVDITSILLCASAFFASYHFKINPVIILIIAGCLGIFIY